MNPYAYPQRCTEGKSCRIADDDGTCRDKCDLAELAKIFSKKKGD
jgi:hypothetical protein